MIPVLGVPVLNRPDLLGQMLMSVDVPVDRTYIVDNGGIIGAWPGAHVCDPGANLGVAASWNLIIRANIDAPWWLLVNNDIVFEAGALERLADTMDTAEPLAATLCGFGAFGINAAAIETVGWFDEHFTPIYYEDSDWQRRALLKGVPQTHVYSDTRHVDGGENATKAVVSDEPHRTKYANRERYQAKWGTGRAGTETFETPFESGQDPAVVTHPPLSWLRQQQWTR